LQNFSDAAFSPREPTRIAAIKMRRLLLLDSGLEPWQVVVRARSDMTLHTLAWAPDSSLLAFGSQQGQIELRDAGLGLRSSFSAHTGTVRELEFSPDATLLASAGADRTARLSATADGRWVVTLAGHAGAVTSVAFAPDEAVLLTTSVDRTALLWPLAPETIRRRVDELLRGCDYTPAQRREYESILPGNR
jgi:WD40 repeat protein